MATAFLTDDEFRKFSSFIFLKTGIYLKPEKKQMLNVRLGKRLKACNLDSFSLYYDYVSREASVDELIHLINSVSTNFTSFFREKDHFNFLDSKILPEFIHSQQQKKLKIWSSACSSGEEPYSLGMILLSFMENHKDLHAEILATDISTKVLDIAEKGIYSEEKSEAVPPEFLRKFFTKDVGASLGQVRIIDNLRRLITFQRVNLMDRFPWHEEMDVIFCRNVMIYFTRETQEQLSEKFYHCLAPGGYFFISHSESLAGINHQFQQVAPTIYKKVK